MAVFDFEQSNRDNGQDRDSKGEVVSVMANGTSLRNTIPKQIADEHDLDDADHLVIEPTDDGFKAKVVDL